MKNSIMRSFEIAEWPMSGPTCRSKLLRGHLISAGE